MADEMSEVPDGDVTGYHVIFDSLGRLYLTPAARLDDRPAFALANMIYDSTGRRISPLRSSALSAPPPLALRPIDAISRIARSLYPTKSPEAFETGRER